MELPAAFSQRIKSTPLTAKEALVAEYILNNFLSVCYVSTSELARILGVSDATVSRTSKVLGYRSFLDLQKEIQSFVSQKADYAQRGLSLIHISISLPTCACSRSGGSPF